MFSVFSLLFIVFLSSQFASIFGFRSHWKSAVRIESLYLNEKNVEHVNENYIIAETSNNPVILRSDPDIPLSSSLPTSTPVATLSSITTFTKDNNISSSSSTNADTNIDNGYYFSCGSCKSVFLFKNAKELEHGIGTKGSRVRCSVCDKQWFQGLDKVSKIDETVSFYPISNQRAEEMKKFILDNNWARNPKGDKIDLFIGNLPFNFDENDISKSVISHY
jgi:hypothetical protein